MNRAPTEGRICWTPSRVKPRLDHLVDEVLAAGVEGA